MRYKGESNAVLRTSIRAFVKVALYAQERHKHRGISESKS